MNELSHSDTSLAPSEEVFLVLQGRPKRNLLSATLKAALLACEDSGVVRLTIVATGPRSVPSPYTVLVTSTGNAVEWPPYSIEARLRFSEHGKLRDLIYEWLCQDASDPWALGVDKIWIGLAIRGVAIVTRRRFGRLAYGVGVLTPAQVAAQANRLDELMAAQENRADLWTLLDREIAHAMDRREVGSGWGRGREADPWADEAETDQLRVLGPVQMVPTTILPSLGGVIAILDGFVAWKLGHVALASVTAAVWIALGTIDLLLWPSARRVLARMWGAMRSRMPRGTPAPTLTAKDRFPSLVFSTPLVVLVTGFGWFGAFIAAIGLAIGAWWLLRKVSGAAISDRVAQEGAAAASANGVAMEPLPVHRAERALPLRGLQLEMIEPAKLPEPSPNAQARLQVIEERAVRLRQTYGRLISQCATAYVLIISAAAVTQGSNPFDSKTIVTAGVLWAAPMLVLWGRTVVRRAGPDSQETQTIQTIRPIAYAGAGGLWFGITLLTIPAYVNRAWPVTLFLLASACLYVVRFRRARAALERRYPLQAPANLLALRVFGSPSLKDFMALTSYWRWMGTTQRLDGPDTSGDKLADVLAVVTGRANKRIIKTEQDLEAALAGFREDIDGELRYTLNSMQCSNATWQQALERLLAKADVVVMDLSGFSSERLGCKYELGKLVEKVGLDRVLLLIDDSTDLGLLEQVLHEAWERTSPDSPNRLAEHSVTLVQTGGLSDRQPNESVYASQRRLQTRLGGKRLVGLLVDMAMAAANNTGRSRTDAAHVVHWAWPWSGGVAGVVRTSMVVLVVLVTLLASTCVSLSPHPELSPRTLPELSMIFQSLNSPTNSSDEPRTVAGDSPAPDLLRPT